MNETKSWLFGGGESNEIDKPLARLTKRKKRRHKLPIPGLKQGDYYRPHRHQRSTTATLCPQIKLR